MTTYTKEELAAILDRHAKWLRGEAGGERADLRGSDLRGSDLRGSNLSDSDLSYSDLRGSNLSDSDLSYSDLRGSDLRDSDLSYSDLRGSNLRDSDLSYSDLRGSNLSDSDLRGSDLRGSDLRGSKFNDATYEAHAAVQFSGHGECGRQLLAIKTSTSVVLMCGCFYGSVDKLKAYIADGAPRLAKTRTLAMETVLMLLDAKNE